MLSYAYHPLVKVHLLPVCKTPGDVTPFPVGIPNPNAAAAFIAEYPQLSRAKDNVQKVSKKGVR